VPGHGRAWELVTTGDTNGAPLVGVRGLSVDGDRVALTTLGPVAGAPAGALLANAMATRSPEGWAVTPLGQPFTVSIPDLEYPKPVAMSADLSSSIWVSDMPLLPDAPPSPQLGIYRRTADGTLTLLGSPGNFFDLFNFIDASADVEHLAFQTQAHLLPADAGRTQGSDAYELAGSTLRLVGVDDAGVPLSACGSVVGNGRPDPSLMSNAVSRDGRRIFFSAPPACGEPNRVYVREDGAHTTEVSASTCGRADCGAPREVTFAGATPDGSQAFLTTDQQLTDDDVDEGMDVYHRSIPGGSLTRLSAGPPGVAANVTQSVVRASDDGERVYFLATGALVPGEGEADRIKLYLSDHGHLRFVTTVDDIDLSRSEITPDGRVLVFTTASALLPSDLDSNTDVYRYDAASGVLTEVSLGVAGRGNEPLNAGFEPTGPFQLAPLPNQPVRHLSNDGRVFFATSEALLPEDRNETVDIYEYADGTLGLVTSGTGDDALAYAGASADGVSVYFGTDASLLPADRDNGDDDLYVARLGGGFPDPASPPTPCTGDACQGPPIGRVDRPSPDSLIDAPDATPQAAPFGLRPLGARARQRLAATGRTQLLVDVPAAGRLSLVARARTSRSRKANGLIVVGRADVTVRRAGVVRVSLRLSRAALDTLHGRGTLLMTLSVRHSTLGAAPTYRLRLSATTRRSHGRRSR